MEYIDVFNGDADGICALVQLRQHEARGGGNLVTGVKRDIALVRRVRAAAGALVTVLDLSFDKNRDAVLDLLGAGVRVRYFDHHRASEVVAHPLFEAQLDAAADICTSLIVDRYLGGARRAWAVVGAFGDNMDSSARAAASTLELSAGDMSLLRELGQYINYNAYGRSVADLYFAPDVLFERLVVHEDPRSFIHDDVGFTVLADGYRADITQAEACLPLEVRPKSAVYMLPDEAWAARVSGVFANLLASAAPQRAHALLTSNADGSYLVSVRAPLERPEGADALCAAFPTGGGRKGAAGINQLAREDFDRFLAAFRTAYA